MRQLLELVQDLWPFSQCFFAEDDTPDPIYEVCMVLNGFPNRILYLRKGRLSGESIQAIMLKAKSKLPSYEQMWKKRVDIHVFGDNAVYGNLYTVEKGIFCLPQNPGDAITDPKSMIEQWFSAEEEKLKLQLDGL